MKAIALTRILCAIQEQENTDNISRVENIVLSKLITDKYCNKVIGTFKFDLGNLIDMLQSCTGTVGCESCPRGY